MELECFCIVVVVAAVVVVVLLRFLAWLFVIFCSDVPMKKEKKTTTMMATTKFVADCQGVRPRKDYTRSQRRFLRCPVRIDEWLWVSEFWLVQLN